MTQATSKEFRIIQTVEFLTLDRAARLLNIDVEEIYQWILSGLVTPLVYVSTNNTEEIFTSEFEIETTPEAVGVPEKDFVSDIEAAIRLTYGMNVEEVEFDPLLWGGSVIAFLYGLFEICRYEDDPSNDELFELLYGRRNSCQVTLLPLPDSKCKNYRYIDPEWISLLGFDEVELELRDIVLSRKDLIKIHDFVNGVSSVEAFTSFLPSFRSEQRKTPNEKGEDKQSKVKEKHAKILNFAYQIFNEFESDITSATRWAGKVIEYAYRDPEWKAELDNKELNKPELNRKRSPEVPMSVDRLTRLLSPHFKVKNNSI